MDGVNEGTLDTGFESFQKSPEVRRCRNADDKGDRTCGKERREWT